MTGFAVPKRLARLFVPRSSEGTSGRSRGSTAVELALVLPPLVLFIFGIIEVGNLYRISLTLNKAAEMGARMAITGQGADDGTRLSVITDTVRQYLTAVPAPAPVITISSWPGINPAQAAVQGDAGRPCQLVEVRVDYTYQTVTPIVGQLLGGRIGLSRFDRKVNEPWIPCI